MQFMEDAIRTPLFRRDELERERPVVLGEYDRQESSPFFHLTRAVDTLLWSPGYYSRKNVIGNREVIATTTPEMMREIQSRYYVPNNTALILSGDITAERGFQLAERVFGDWPRGEDPFAEPVANPPPLGESKAVIVERPVGAATLLLSWHGPSVGEDPAATYAADIFLNVIRSEASGFQQRLVQSGLATGASLGYYTQDKTGPIQIFAQTTPEKLLELERAILDEVRRMAEPDYVTPEQLEAARNRVEVGTVYEREQSRALAHTVGFWWAVAGIPYYKDYTANMQRATREDIAKFVQDYMISKPYVAGVLISPADRQRINLQPSDLLMGEVQR
jgi:zinc protease